MRINDKFKTDCMRFTFDFLDEALERVKEENNLKLIKEYENLIKQGEKIIPLCKGPDAPDYCFNIKIESCKGCKDYKFKIKSKWIRSC